MVRKDPFRIASNENVGKRTTPRLYPDQASNTIGVGFFPNADAALGVDGEQVTMFLNLQANRTVGPQRFVRTSRDLGRPLPLTARQKIEMRHEEEITALRFLSSFSRNKYRLF